MTITQTTDITEIKINKNMNIIGKHVTHQAYPNVIWVITEYNRNSGEMKLKSNSEIISTHISKCKAVNN